MVRFQIFLRKLGDTILGIIKILLLSKFKTILSYQPYNKDIVIFGNGPSLKATINQKDGFLTDKDILCVNFFPLTDTFEKTRPRVFIISAPELWINNVDKRYKEKKEELVEALKKKNKLATYNFNSICKQKISIMVINNKF